MGVTASLVKAMGLGTPLMPSTMLATLCSPHSRCDVRALLQALTGWDTIPADVPAGVLEAMQVMVDTCLVTARVGVATGPLGLDFHTRPADAAAAAALEVPDWDVATAADLAAATAPVTPDSHLLVQMHVPACACHPNCTRAITVSVALAHLLDLPCRVRATTPDVQGFLASDTVVPAVVRMALGDSNPAKDMPPTVSFHNVHVVVTAGVSTNGSPTLMFALSNPVAGTRPEAAVTELSAAMGFSAVVVPGEMGLVLGTWRCAMLGHRPGPLGAAAAAAAPAPDDEYVEVDDVVSDSPVTSAPAGDPEAEAVKRVAVGRCAACAGHTDARLAACQHRHLFRLVGQVLAARRGWSRVERAAVANTFLRTVLSPQAYDAAVAAGASCLAAAEAGRPAGKPSRGKGVAKALRVCWGTGAPPFSPDKALRVVWASSGTMPK